MHIFFLDYKIVIICNNEDEEKSNIISKLQTFRRQYQGFHSNDRFLQYLKEHFVQEPDDTSASSVDDDKLDNLLCYMPNIMLILSTGHVLGLFPLPELGWGSLCILNV